jgi:hypothetical protein
MTAVPAGLPNEPCQAHFPMKDTPMSRKLVFAFIFAISAVALMPICHNAAAQQPQGRQKLSQFRFNPSAAPVDPRQSRNTAYTLGRLQGFQMSLNKVRTLDRGQIVTPPKSVSGR